MQPAARWPHDVSLTWQLRGDICVPIVRDRPDDPLKRRAIMSA
jgi:hypothetical protein